LALGWISRFGGRATSAILPTQGRMTMNLMS
jgi:hypothetical protein